MCKYNSIHTLIPKVDFHCTVDHLVLTYVMKTKTETANARRKRLLEVFGVYSLNIYYMKKKDMTLSKFLLRIKVDKSKSHEMIPMSFDLREVLQEMYYIQARSGTEKAGITVGKIYGHDKSLLFKLKSEKSS